MASNARGKRFSIVARLPTSPDDYDHTESFHRVPQCYDIFPLSNMTNAVSSLITFTWTMIIRLGENDQSALGMTPVHTRLEHVAGCTLRPRRRGIKTCSRKIFVLCLHRHCCVC
jgi:hypothetical protein